KRVGKGSGLGLSQVYGFVKQSGGSVNVRSEFGAGATFTIYIPRRSGDAGARSIFHPGPGEFDHSNAGAAVPILVVEDDEHVGRFCVGLLEDLGYRPTWARSAGDALQWLEQDTAQFDLVFSDVVMPGMSGIELAERLSELRPKLPVLLTSGYSA